MVTGLELNFEKVNFCSGDNAPTDKLSDITLEYDTIFDKHYATKIVQLSAGAMLIPYPKITSVYYQKPSMKVINWKTDNSNLSVRSLTGLLLLFLDKRDDFDNRSDF